MRFKHRILTKQELVDKVGSVIIWPYVIEVGYALGNENEYLSSVRRTEEFKQLYDVSQNALMVTDHIFSLVVPFVVLSMMYFSQIAAQYTILLSASYTWLTGHLISAMRPGNFSALVAGRILKSGSLGALLYILPLYIQRNCKTRYRCGLMLVLFQAGIPCGALITKLIGHTNDSLQQKWILGGVAVYPMCILLCYLPRNETQLIRIDQYCDFDYRSLSRIPTGKQKFLHQLSFLGHKGTRRRVWAAIVAQIIGSLCGVPCTISLSGQMAEWLELPLHRHTEEALLGIYASSLYGCAVFIPNFPKPVTIKASLIAIGFCFMGMWILAMVYRMQLNGSETNPEKMHAISFSIMVLMCMQTIVYSLGVVGLSLVYAVERSPYEARQVSLGVGISLNLLFYWLLRIGLPHGTRKHTEYIFLVFGYTCFVLFVIASCIMR